MACGDKYKALFAVVNWNDAGPFSKPRSWDDPWTGSPGPIDYRNWRNNAIRATDLMWEALEQLGQIETDLGKGFPKYNDLNDGAVAIFNRRNDLPFAIALDLSEPAQEALQIVKDAACHLELINDAIEGYGGKPATKPGPMPKPKGGGGGSWLDALVPWLAVAVIGVGVYYADKSDDDEGG